MFCISSLEFFWEKLRSTIKNKSDSRSSSLDAKQECLTSRALHSAHTLSAIIVGAILISRSKMYLCGQVTPAHTHTRKERTYNIPVSSIWSTHFYSFTCNAMFYKIY
jgi:hypothetical protein